MSKFTFIVNPAAAKGSAKRFLAPLREQLQRRGITHELLLTAGPGDATAFARSATTPVVVAVGGDGTVNEVANGLLGSSKVLGVVPTGSGNDFVKSIGIPHALNGALDHLIAGRSSQIDVGTVRCSSGNPGGGGNSSPRCFVNGVGVGFDAAVAARTMEIGYLRGTALYIMAVFQTLGKYRAPLFDIQVDEHRQQTRNLLIAIGNGRCAGGGFYLTPDATVDDGLLDLCIIDDLSLLKILRLMPKVMRSNHHLEEGVSFLKGKKIHLDAETPFYVHADGEIVGRNVRDVAVEIQAKQLTVIVGEMPTGSHG